MFSLAYFMILFTVMTGVFGGEGDSRIQLSEPSHDFGTINDRNTVAHPFLLENTGAKDLTLQRVDLGANCMVSRVMDGYTLKPGEKMDFMVYFNPKGLHGAQERLIKIHSNAPETPVLSMTIKAFIEVDYQLSPPFIYFKELRPGEKVCQTVQIRSFMEKPLEIKEIQSSDPCFSASFRKDEAGYFLDVQADETQIPSGESRVTGRIVFQANSETTPSGMLVVLAVAPERSVDESLESAIKEPVPNGEIKAQRSIQEIAEEARKRAPSFLIGNPSNPVEEEVPPAPDPNAPKPKLVVDKDVHDFGNVNQGEELEAHFQISNEGEADLTIHRVQSSCGCATVNELRGTKIPPGGSEPLVVRLSTKNKYLDLTKAVTIYSDDPVLKNKRLEIKAHIHVDYLVKGPVPKFDDIRKGMVVKERLLVQSYMDKELVLSDFDCPYEYMSCSFGKGEKEGEYYIEATLDAREAALPSQPFFGRVQFKSNSEQLPEDSFCFTLVAIKDIKVEPNKVFLHRYDEARKEEQVLTLTNVLGKPFSIKGVVCDIEALETEILDETHLALRIKKDAQPGRFRTELTILLNYADQESVEVPITVIIRV